MRLLRMGVTSCIVVTGLGLGFTGRNLIGQNLAGDSWKLEARGDGATAREQLRRAAENAPSDPLALEAYAAFLDRHRDPAARDVYQKLSDLLAANRASAGERARIARRLVTLDLIAGNREAAARHLEEYRSAGGTAPGVFRRWRSLPPRQLYRDSRTAALVRPHGRDFPGRRTR